MADGERPRLLRMRDTRLPAARGHMGQGVAPRMLLLSMVVTVLTWSGVGVCTSASADHSAVLQLNDRAGPYVLMAWTQPRRPRTDWCQVTVTVMRPGNFRPISDAVVRVRAERADGAGPPVSVAATRDRDPLGLSYLADLALPGAGQWTVTIEVSGPAGAGRAEFPLDVEAPSWEAWPFVAAGLVLLGLAAVWLARRGRPRAATAARREEPS